jgi:hypothetical protein
MNDVPESAAGTARPTAYDVARVAGVSIRTGEATGERGRA